MTRSDLRETVQKGVMAPGFPPTERSHQTIVNGLENPVSLSTRIYGRRAFAVIGPTVWIWLGNDMRDPDLNIASFGRLFQTKLFQQYSVHQAQ